MKITLRTNTARRAWCLTRGLDKAAPEYDTYYCQTCILAMAISRQANLSPAYEVAVEKDSIWLYQRQGEYDQVIKKVRWSATSKQQVARLLDWFDGLPDEEPVGDTEGFFAPPIAEIDLPEVDRLLKGVIAHEPPTSSDRAGAETPGE